MGGREHVKVTHGASEGSESPTYVSGPRLATAQASGILDTVAPPPATLGSLVPLPTFPSPLSSKAPPGDLERTQSAGADLAEARPRRWATMTGYPQGAGLAAHTGNTRAETWHTGRESLKGQRGKVRQPGLHRGGE